MITEIFTSLAIILYSTSPAMALINNNTCQRIESGCVSLGDYCIPQSYCSYISICSNLCSINYSCSYNRLCSPQIEGDDCVDNTDCVGENLPSMLEPYMTCNGRCVIDKNPTKLLPNDNCTTDSGCWSNVCSNDTYLSPGIYVCSGGSMNDKCNQNRDCNPGFFCERPDNLCKAQIPSGVTGCNKDNDCLSRLDNCQPTGHGNKICYTINSANVNESCVYNDECKDGYFCLNGICAKPSGTDTGLACYNSTVNCSSPNVCTCDYNMEAETFDQTPSCQPFTCNSPFMCEKELVNYCMDEEAEYRMCLNNNNCHSESDPQKYGSCAFECLPEYKTYKLCTVQIGLEFAQESCRYSNESKIIMTSSGTPIWTSTTGYEESSATLLISSLF